MRFFKTILLGAIGFGLASAGFAQEPQKLITIESRGAPAKTLFEELSKQVGENLMIGQSLALEPLVLRIEKAPLDQLMAKLAFIFDAEWMNEPTGKRLIAIKRPPTAKATNALERIQKQQQKVLERLKENPEFSATDAKTLAEQLDEHFRKQAAKTPSNEYDFDSEGSKIARKGPFTGFAYRVFTQLDPKELALVSKSRRMVWSTQPTAMQRSLPASVWTAVKQFQKENGFWRDAVGSRQFQIDMNRGIPTDLYQLIQKNSNWGGDPNEADDASPPVKVIVAGTSWGDGLSQLEVKLIDAKGKYVATCNMDTWSLDRDVQAPYEPPKKDPNSLKIELDALGREFGKRFQNRYEQDAQLEPMSRELEEYLLNPDKNEPLALMAGQALVKYATAKKSQLVAVLLDMSIYMYGVDEKGVIDAEMMMTMLRTKGWGYRTEEKDGWIATGPTPSEMIEGLSRNSTRIDRKAVGRLLRNAKKAGYLTFEDSAEFLISTVKDVNEEPNYLVSYLLGFFVKDTNLIASEDSRKLMLIYGSMDPLQLRRSVLEGRTIPLRSLSPSQQEVIRGCVFGRDIWRIRFEPKAEPGQQLDSKVWETYHNGIGSEPTERFANGLHPQSPVTCKLTNSTMLRCIGGVQGQTYHMETTAEGLGSQMFYQSLPDHKSYGGYDGNYTGFQSVSRRTMNFRVQLDDATYLSMDAHEVISQSPKVDSYEKLPADILQKIEAGRKSAEEGYKNRPKTPPPPPRFFWW